MTLQRQNLSEKEHKVWAAKFGLLRGSTCTNGTGSGSSTNGTGSRKGPAASWFTVWQKETKTPKQTAVNWWNDYKTVNDLTIPPGKPP